MASFRPEIPPTTDAVLKLALQVLNRTERERLTQLLGEFAEGTCDARSANAVTDLATAAEVLVAVTEFATALGTAGWEVAD